MANPASHGAQGDAHPTVGHVVPIRILAGVGLALAVFTILTVAVTRVDLGASWNLFVAMAIATIKGSLVVLYFMHLRWDRPFNAVVLISALVFLFLFISFALMDTISYERDLIPGYAPDLNK
jgi:cytochrome c oxidase subunit 4